MRRFIGACLGCGAVLLLAAPGRAADPADGGESRQVAQADRSRGFFGFPDWDSRSGGYDRSRRAEPEDKKGKGKEGFPPGPGRFNPFGEGQRGGPPERGPDPRMKDSDRGPGKGDDRRGPGGFGPGPGGPGGFGPGPGGPGGFGPRGFGGPGGFDKAKEQPKPPMAKGGPPERGPQPREKHADKKPVATPDWRAGPPSRGNEKAKEAPRPPFAKGGPPSWARPQEMFGRGRDWRAPSAGPNWRDPRGQMARGGPPSRGPAFGGPFAYGPQRGHSFDRRMGPGNFGHHSRFARPQHQSRGRGHFAPPQRGRGPAHFDRRGPGRPGMPPAFGSFGRRPMPSFGRGPGCGGRPQMHGQSFGRQSSFGPSRGPWGAPPRFDPRSSWGRGSFGGPPWARDQRPAPGGRRW